MALTEEHKQKMAEGRRLAAERRKAEQNGEKKTAVDKAEKRPRRTSLAEARDTMTVEGIPDGYVGRWVNDTGNRILRLQERGYEFVADTERGRIAVGEKGVDPNRQTGKVVSKVVGTDEKTNKPLISYLMAQRVDFYEDDQKFKQSEIDKTVEQIYDRISDDGLLDTNSPEYKRA